MKFPHPFGTLYGYQENDSPEPMMDTGPQYPNPTDISNPFFNNYQSYKTVSFSYEATSPNRIVSVSDGTVPWSVYYWTPELTVDTLTNTEAHISLTTPDYQSTDCQFVVEPNGLQWTTLGLCHYLSEATVTDPRGIKTIYDNVFWTSNDYVGWSYFGRHDWPGYRILGVRDSNGKALEEYDWWEDGRLREHYVHDDGPSAGYATLWDWNSGNLTRATKLGGAFNASTAGQEYAALTYTYNPADPLNTQLATVDEPSPTGRKVTQYTYDSQYKRRVIMKVEDFGGKNITTEYGYNSFGNPSSTVGPYEGTRPANPPTVTNEYNDFSIRRLQGLPTSVEGAARLLTPIWAGSCGRRL